MTEARGEARYRSCGFQDTYRTYDTVHEAQTISRDGTHCGASFW